MHLLKVALQQSYLHQLHSPGYYDEDTGGKCSKYSSYKEIDVGGPLLQCKSRLLVPESH